MKLIQKKFLFTLNMIIIASLCFGSQNSVSAQAQVAIKGISQATQNINIDFDTIVHVPEDLHNPIYEILADMSSSSSLPDDDLFYSTAFRFSDDGNEARVVIVPSYVIDTGWEYMLMGDLIEFWLEQDSAGNWIKKSEDPLPQQSQAQASSLEFRFPWTDNLVWNKNGGFHSAGWGGLPNLAVDFTSSTSNIAVLASESGTVDSICGPDNSGQVWLRISHANGNKTGYGHLSGSSIPSGILGNTVVRGQYLGNLYNPNPGGTFDTYCGYGYSPHLHFIFPNTSITMYDKASQRNVPASEIGLDTWTQYTSNNVPPPPPSVFGKTDPENNTTIALPSSSIQLLKWSSANISSPNKYQYCIDIIDNQACDSVWNDRGPSSTYVYSEDLTLLPGSTYYWQVRTKDDQIYADTGTWWSFTVQPNYPSVTSIARSSSTPTNASNVSFTVTFDQAVTGVDPSDFSLATTGVLGASVSGVSWTGSAYNVTVNTGTGSGTIQLNLVDNDSIINIQSTPLGGVGAGNGNYSGETYTIDKIPPTVVSILRANPNPTSATTAAFTVTFSEIVTGVDIAGPPFDDFAITTSSGISGASVIGVSCLDSVNKTECIVTVNTGTGAHNPGTSNGTIRLDVPNHATFTDLIGNSGMPFTTGQEYTIDQAPKVLSIVRANSSPTYATTINFTVTFSESVKDVDTADFYLTKSGVSGTFVSAVNGSGNIRTVEVNTGTGNGTIRLDVPIGATIHDLAGNVGLPFGLGQTYTIDRAPIVNTIARANLTPTSAAAINFTVTFSESVTGVGLNDFSLYTPGISGATVSEISGSGSTYTVKVNTGTGTGTIRLDVPVSATIADLIGNPLGSLPYTTGAIYTIDKTPPTVVGSVRANISPTYAPAINFTVTFSKPVIGVDKADFNLTVNGVSAFISAVSGSGNSYKVTVKSRGNGTIRLNVADNNSIVDALSNPLGGPAIGDGNFTIGEVYTVSNSGGDTTGVFRPSNGDLYLKNANTTGFAEIAFNFGQAGDYPVTGDWDGNGTATIGIYRNGVFYLRNSNTAGFADIVFAFGASGDQPVVGDWNGDGIDTIGFYRSSAYTFYLRDSNTAGEAQISFSLGVPGDVGIAGDWNGDGLDTVGVFRPSSGALYLKNTNTSGNADIAINYGMPGDQPVTGDWDDNGTDTIGVYRNGQFLLRNSNTIGFAEIAFSLGGAGDIPIIGNWNGVP